MLPVNFSYLGFAALIFLNSVGMGMFIAPNQTGIMNSLPANQRGAGAGMAGTFNASAQVLSIGIFFSLMILGLAATLPSSLYHGLIAQGVSPAVATQGLASAPGRKPLRRLPGLQPDAGAAGSCRAVAAAALDRGLPDQSPVLPPPDRPRLLQGPDRGLLLRRRRVSPGSGGIAPPGRQVSPRGRGDGRRRTPTGSPPRRRWPRPSRCWSTDMAVSTQRKRPGTPVHGGRRRRPGIRISDAATRVGVSARTLRYYEELGLLTPSLYTPGGERRYTPDDLAHLQRILELREVLGMNLDEIREFLALETRLDELRASYRATKDATSKKALAEQKATLQEALVLNESLAEQISAKLARMDGFRAKLRSDAQRCRELLDRVGVAAGRRRVRTLAGGLRRGSGAAHQGSRGGTTRPQREEDVRRPGLPRRGQPGRRGERSRRHPGPGRARHVRTDWWPPRRRRSPSCGAARCRAGSGSMPMISGPRASSRNGSTSESASRSRCRAKG